MCKDYYFIPHGARAVRYVTGSRGKSTGEEP